VNADVEDDLDKIKSMNHSKKTWPQSHHIRDANVDFVALKNNHLSPY